MAVSTLSRDARTVQRAVFESQSLGACPVDATYAISCARVALSSPLSVQVDAASGDQHVGLEHHLPHEGLPMDGADGLLFSCDQHALLVLPGCAQAERRVPAGRAQQDLATLSAARLCRLVCGALHVSDAVALRLSVSEFYVLHYTIH